MYLEASVHWNRQKERAEAAKLLASDWKPELCWGPGTIDIKNQGQPFLYDPSPCKVARSKLGANQESSYTASLQNPSGAHSSTRPVEQPEYLQNDHQSCWAMQAKLDWLRPGMALCIEKAATMPAKMRLVPMHWTSPRLTTLPAFWSQDRRANMWVYMSGLWKCRAWFEGTTLAKRPKTNKLRPKWKNQHRMNSQTRQMLKGGYRASCTFASDSLCVSSEAPRNWSSCHDHKLEGCGYGLRSWSLKHGHFDRLKSISMCLDGRTVFALPTKSLL